MIINSLCVHQERNKCTMGFRRMISKNHFRDKKDSSQSFKMIARIDYK